MIFNDKQKLYLSQGIVNRETIRAFRHDNFHKVAKNAYILKDLKVTLDQVIKGRLPAGYAWIAESDLWDSNQDKIHIKNGLASTGDVIGRVRSFDRDNIYIIQVIQHDCFSKDFKYEDFSNLKKYIKSNHSKTPFDQLLNTEMEIDWYKDYKIEVAKNRGTIEDVKVPKEHWIKFLELKVKTIKRLLNTDITMKKFLSSQRHIDCLDKYEDIIKKSGRYFLLDCVMRFGKSFIYLEMIKNNYHNMGECKAHAIFCHDTKTYRGWKDKVEDYYSDCIDIVELRKQKDFDFTATLSKNVVILISPQLISSDEKINKLKKLNISVENTFVDEAHDYFSERWRNYYESITRNNIALASGTAAGIKITYRDFFDEYNTYTFTLFDLIRVLKEEDGIVVKPIIKRIKLSDLANGKTNMGNIQGVDELNRLENPQEAESMLKALHDKNLRTSPLTYKHTKHIVALVDRVKFVNFWIDYIENHPELNIVPISIAGGKRDVQDEKELKEKMAKAEVDGKYTLTISCGSMIQGVSIRQWKEVMNLSSVATYTKYFQFFGRTWEFDRNLDSNGEFELVCWDYNPTRTMKVLAQGVESLLITDNTMTNSSLKGINYFFNTMSIFDFYSDSNGFQEVPIENILNEIRENVDKSILGTGFRTRKIADTKNETIFGLDQDFIEHLMERKTKVTKKQSIKIKEFKSELDKQKSNYTKGQGSGQSVKVNKCIKSILDKIIEGLNSYTDKIDIVMEVLLKKGLINYKNINELFPLYDNELVISGFGFPSVEVSKQFMDYIENFGDKIKINKKLENNQNRLPNIMDIMDKPKAEFFEICGIYDEVYTYGGDKSQVPCKSAYTILQTQLNQNIPKLDSTFLVKYAKSGSLQLSLSYLLYNKSMKYFGKQLTKQEVINMVEFQENDNKFFNLLNTTLGFKKSSGVDKKDYIIINPPYKKGKHLEIFNESFEQLGDGGTLICIHPSTPFINRKPTKDDGKTQKIKDIISKYKSRLTLVDGNKIFDAGFFTPLSITRVERVLDEKIEVVYSHIDSNNKEVKVYDKLDDIFIHGNDIVLKIKDRIFSKIDKSLEDYNGRTDSSKKYNFYIKTTSILGNIPKSGKLNPDFFCLIYKSDENNFNKVLHDTYENGYNYIGGYDKKTAVNMFEYFKTKFVRFAISIYKLNQNLHRGELMAVPYMDFSQKWTDEKLFDYFELTQEERDFINTYIQNWYDRDN